MLHEPAGPSGPDYATGYKTRLGAIMFVFYAAVYVGFIAINFVKPELMGVQVLAGMNLAVVYGLGLIVFALVLAIVYNRLCTARERAMKKQAQADGEVTR